MLSSSGTTPSATMPIRKLFESSKYTDFDRKEDFELNRLADELKSKIVKESYKDDKEDVSLTLSQSPDSYAIVANNMSKSQQK